MWGFCVECYQNWQDQYLDSNLLFDTAKMLGTTALLLIRPEVQWVGYIKDNLPVSYCRKRSSDSDLVEWKPKLQPKIAINVRAEVHKQVNKTVPVEIPRYASLEDRVLEEAKW